MGLLPIWRYLRKSRAMPVSFWARTIRDVRARHSVARAIARAQANCVPCSRSSSPHATCREGRGRGEVGGNEGKGDDKLESQSIALSEARNEVGIARMARRARKKDRERDRGAYGIVSISLVTPLSLDDPTMISCVTCIRHRGREGSARRRK